VNFVVGGGFRGFRFLGCGFRASDWISWISWISLFRQTGPTVSHKHLTLIKYENGENTYKVHCMKKNTYKHNILLSE